MHKNKCDIIIIDVYEQSVVLGLMGRTTNMPLQLHILRKPWNYWSINMERMTWN